MDVTFSSCSVQELHNFLKLRGVLITGLRKLDLVRLCQAAHNISIEIDPDGFLEDKEEFIGEKLKIRIQQPMWSLHTLGYWGTINGNNIHRIVSFQIIVGGKKA